MRDEVQKTLTYIAAVLWVGVNELDGWELDDETKREVMDCLEDVEEEAANCRARMEEIADRLEDAYNRATKENA